MVGVKVQACRDEVEKQGRQTNKFTKVTTQNSGIEPLGTKLNVM